MTNLLPAVIALIKNNMFHDPNNKRSVIFAWFPAVFWIIILFIGAVLPSNDLMDVPIYQFDKLVHLIGYTALSILILRGLYFSGKVNHTFNALFALILADGYGIVLELIQGFIPGREASVGDIMANTAGIVLGIILGRFYYGRHKAL